MIQKCGRSWLARRKVWRTRQRHVLRNLAAAAAEYVVKKEEERREKQWQEEQVRLAVLEAEQRETLQRLERQWQEGQREETRVRDEREQEQRERVWMEEADGEAKAGQLWSATRQGLGQRQGPAQGQGLGQGQGPANDEGKAPPFTSGCSPRHRREAKGQGLARRQGLGPANEQGLAPEKGLAQGQGLAERHGLSTPVIAQYASPYSYNFSPLTLHREAGSAVEVGVGAGVGGICVSGSMMGEGFGLGVSRIVHDSGCESGMGSESFVHGGLLSNPLSLTR